MSFPPATTGSPASSTSTTRTPRELHHEGKVNVILVPTAENYSDLLTKALSTDVFTKHRRTIFNLAARPSTSTA